MDDHTIIEIMKNFFDYWQNFILAGGVFVAIFVAFWTVLYDKKNLKLNGLNLAFKKLNDIQERESRRNILSAYYNYLIDNDFSIEYTSKNFLQSHPLIDLSDLYPILKEDVERVKANFNEIAVMEKNGLVNKKAYFEAYYGSMLRCYGALHGNIEKSRDRTGSKEYTSLWQQQCVDAVKFWNKNYDKSEIKYHQGNERRDFLLNKFEEDKFWKIRIQHPKSPISECVVYWNKVPIPSQNTGDSLAHTISEGGGAVFLRSKTDSINIEKDMITIKSDGIIIRRIRFADIESSNP